MSKEHSPNTDGSIHMRRLRHCFVPVAVAAFALLGLPAAASAQGQAAPVRVDAVRTDTVQQHRHVTGNVRAVARSRVAAMEAGIVVDLPIHEGQRVGRDQVLARLDDRRIVIQLRQIEAQLAVLEAIIVEREAELHLRESDVETLARLEERGAVNPKEVADARLEVQVAVARRDQAHRELAATEAAADLLRRRLADTVIRAPFDGVVVSRLCEVGEWIAEGSPTAEIVAVNTFDVWLDVPQRHAAAASVDDLRVGVHVEAVERDYSSQAVRVIREVDPMARTFSLIVRIEDEDDLLSPGMSVTAWVPTGAMSEQLTIHKDAILRGDAGAFVYAVRQSAADSPAQAIVVPVQPLFDVHDRVVVRSTGLTNGDVVVVEGNERLMPMQAVRIVEEPFVTQSAARPSASPAGTGASDSASN